MRGVGLKKHSCWQRVPVLLSLTLFTGCGSGFSSSLAPQQASCEIVDNDLVMATDVLDRVNEERLRVGLDALELDVDLSVFAADYACTLIVDDFFQHTHPVTGETAEQRISHSEYSCHLFGENLAKGQLSSEDVVNDWLDSETHLANIIEPQFEMMGLGVARRDYDGRLFWVQMFIGASLDNCALHSAAPKDEDSEAAPGFLSGELKIFPDLPVSLPLSESDEKATTPEVTSEADVPSSVE